MSHPSFPFLSFPYGSSPAYTPVSTSNLSNVTSSIYGNFPHKLFMSPTMTTNALSGPFDYQKIMQHNYAYQALAAAMNTSVAAGFAANNLNEPSSKSKRNPQYFKSILLVACHFATYFLKLSTLLFVCPFDFVSSFVAGGTVSPPHRTKLCAYK